MASAQNLGLRNTGDMTALKPGLTAEGDLWGSAAALSDEPYQSKGAAMKPVLAANSQTLACQWIASLMALAMGKQMVPAKPATRVIITIGRLASF